MLHNIAYIDPGTGSLFIQAVLGTVLAGIVVLRTVIRKIFSKMKPAFSRQLVSDEEA
jgi:hypothetical protein